MHLDGTLNGAEVNVAMGRRNVSACAEARGGYVAPSRVHRNPRGFGDHNGHVHPAAGIAFRLHHDRSARHRHVRRFRGEDLGRFHVGVGVGHGMCLDLHRGGVAGRHAYVATRILNLDGGIGRDLRVKHLLVHVMLGPAEHVEEVVMRAPLGAHGIPKVVSPGCTQAQNGQQDEDTDKTATATDRSLAPEIERPFAQQGQPGSDEQERPPVPIPGPEFRGGDAIGINEQPNDAGGDQQKGTDDGRNARTVGANHARLPGVLLRSPLIPLRAPSSLLLLSVHAPLGVRIIRGRHPASGRCGRRYAAHDCPPFLSRSKSSSCAGTIEVPGCVTTGPAAGLTAPG